MEKEYVVLSNGIKMPIVGFGTFKTGDEAETIDSVKSALQVGYRQIDAAAYYGNEEAVGKGLKESNVPREEIFLVSKLWNYDHGYDNTIKSFNESLKRLDVDYLDMYLIHWPNKLNLETWRAFEDLYEEGKIKAIGVCNFKENHLEELIKNSRIMPMVNQIEIHPHRSQKEMIKYCNDRKIQVVGWCPLMRGGIFSIPLMNELSEKYKKSIAQITLRWHLQNGVIAIPKSTNIERIKANFDIFDFEISNEDMMRIDSLDIGESISAPPLNTTYLDV